MVALDEQLHHKDTPSRLQGTGYRLQRGGVSARSRKSVDVYNLQRSMITDQKCGISNDLFIDQCSSVIERSARNRNYSPSLGRWINQDPAGYINGANTYQFVMSNPVGNVDPQGTGTPYGGIPYPQWQKIHPVPPWRKPCLGDDLTIAGGAIGVVGLAVGVVNPIAGFIIGAVGIGIGTSSIGTSPCGCG